MDRAQQRGLLDLSTDLFADPAPAPVQEFAQPPGLQSHLYHLLQHWAHITDNLGMADLRHAVIVGGNRIPFARANGPYARASNQDMLTAALDGLVARFGLQNARLGEVAAGAVLKHSRDFNLTREAVLGARLSPWTPAYDVQQACGTGLETTIHVANKIALGQIEAGVSGGVDTTSDAPIEVNDDLRRILIKANAAKSNTDRAKLLTQLRPGHIVPNPPRNS